MVRGLWLLTLRLVVFLLLKQGYKILLESLQCICVRIIDHDLPSNCATTSSIVETRSFSSSNFKIHYFLSVLRMRCKEQNAKSSCSEKSGAICLQLCKCKTSTVILTRPFVDTVTFTGLRLERQTKTFVRQKPGNVWLFQSGYGSNGCNNFK